VRMVQVFDSNLESQPWEVQTGESVNPVPVLAYTSEQVTSGPFQGALKVTNVSGAALGGALVTCKCPVPLIPGVSLPYLGLDMQVYIPSFELPNLARLEIDAKVVLTSAPNAETSIANTADFSGQWNQSTGQWQIDNASAEWTNTGFSPVLVSDVWMTFSARYFIDIPNSKFSVLSITWNGTEFTIPASLQEIPFLSSNWDAVAALQIQMETLLAGSVTVLFKNITLTWSDHLF
jgi:hypothetical protein